ncbi:MAG: hypothetical protein KDK12_02970 [Rhodobacteraceae bacterium]|nr:hypothetical protein [Paracoccaceae bacterium]
MHDDIEIEGRDPARRKARDNARQRKLACNDSDKAARRHIRQIKAQANRKLRRLDKAALAAADDDTAGTRLGLKTRARSWGSSNAAAHRAARTDERAFLDTTPVTGCHGRQRGALRHID